MLIFRKGGVQVQDQFRVEGGSGSGSGSVGGRSDLVEVQVHVWLQLRGLFEFRFGFNPGRERRFKFRFVGSGNPVSDRNASEHWCVELERGRVVSCGFGLRCVKHFWWREGLFATIFGRRGGKEESCSGSGSGSRGPAPDQSREATGSSVNSSRHLDRRLTRCFFLSQVVC